MKLLTRCGVLIEEEGGSAMLRQLHVVCNSSNRRGGFLPPDWHSDYARDVSTADSGHRIC